jgi:hypothetical protein
VMDKRSRLDAGTVCKDCGVFVRSMRRHRARGRCDAVKSLRALRGK